MVPRTGPLFAAACASVLAAGVAHDARASAFEVLGFGPAGVAEVGARTARADDGTATFYSPGGLGLGHGIGLELTPGGGVSALSAQGKTLALTDPFGVSLAFDATIPFTGPLKDRIRVGFGSYLPPSGAFHLTAHASTDPQFPYYDNRTQRLVLLPGIAVRILDGLAVGVAFNVLGGVSGPATVENGASGAPEPRLALTAATTLAVNAGVRFDPTQHARLALAVRQRFSTPAEIDSSATVAGVPLTINVGAHGAMFDPTTVVVAGSFDVGHASFELDASYAVWSAYAGPWVTVQATLPGVNLVSSLPTNVGRDVVGVRGAATYSIPVLASSEVVLRAGAGFEPSMLKTVQQGAQNLLDGDKILFGLGASFVLRALPVALRFGFGGNVQGVLSYAQAKRTCVAAPCAETTVGGPDAQHPSQGIDNPGYPRLEGGGTFWSLGFGVGAEL